MDGADDFHISFSAEPERAVNGLSSEFTVDKLGLFGVRTIREAIVQAKDGDCIKILPGIYFESIVLNKRVSLIGCPSSLEKCVINGISGPALHILTRTDYRPEILISGIHFETSQYADSKSSYPSVIVQTGNIRFSECTVSNPHSLGLHVKSNQQSPPTTISIERCTFKDCDDDGIMIDYCHSVAIKECSFISNKGTSITVRSHSNVAIERCLVTSSNVGISYSESSTGNVTNCTIAENVLSNVIIRTAADPHMKNNKIVQGTHSGVFIYHGGKGVVEENEVYDNLTCGIHMETHSTTHILHNKIRGSSTGIVVGKYGKGVVEYNEITGYQICGIELQADASGKVTRNKINGNGQAGLLFSDASHAEVSDNGVFGRNMHVVLKTPASREVDSPASRFGDFTAI